MELRHAEDSRIHRHIVWVWMNRSDSRIQVDTIRTYLLQTILFGLRKCRLGMAEAAQFFRDRNVQLGTQGQSSWSEQFCCSRSQQCNRSSCVGRVVWFAGSRCQHRTRIHVLDKLHRHLLEDSSDPSDILSPCDTLSDKRSQVSIQCTRQFTLQQ